MKGILFPEIEKRNMEKSCLNFRDIFLIAGGYMQRPF